MQIRVQAKRIQLVRTKYSKEEKRMKALPVLSYGYWERECPPEILEQLTEQEREQIVAHHAKKNAVRDASMHEHSARFLSEQIEKALAGMHAMSMQDLEKLTNQITRLKRAITRRSRDITKSQRPQESSE